MSKFRKHRINKRMTRSIAKALDEEESVVVQHKDEASFTKHMNAKGIKVDKRNWSEDPLGQYLVVRR